MTETKEKWASWIDELLKLAKINGSELADMVGVSRMAVCKWRNRGYPNIPSPAHREKLLEVAENLGLL